MKLDRFVCRTARCLSLAYFRHPTEFYEYKKRVAYFALQSCVCVNARAHTLTDKERELGVWLGFSLLAAACFSLSHLTHSTAHLSVCVSVSAGTRAQIYKHQLCVGWDKVRCLIKNICIFTRLRTALSLSLSLASTIRNLLVAFRFVSFRCAVLLLYAFVLCV